MCAFIRKMLIGLICASLAVANGLAPKHAHAKASSHGGVDQHVTKHSHHGSDQDHHHDEASDRHDHALASEAGLVDAAQDAGAGVPIVNCCVTSCAAMAFIFATVDLSMTRTAGPIVVAPLDSVVIATRTTDDPPPR